MLKELLFFMHTMRTKDISIVIIKSRLIWDIENIQWKTYKRLDTEHLLHDKNSKLV